MASAPRAFSLSLSPLPPLLLPSPHCTPSQTLLTLTPPPPTHIRKVRHEKWGTHTLSAARQQHELGLSSERRSDPLSRSTTPKRTRPLLRVVHASRGCGMTILHEKTHVHRVCGCEPTTRPEFGRGACWLLLSRCLCTHSTLHRTHSFLHIHAYCVCAACFKQENTKECAICAPALHLRSDSQGLQK